MPQRPFITSFDSQSVDHMPRDQGSHRRPVVLRLSARADLALSKVGGGRGSSRDDRQETEPGLPFETGSDTNPETNPDIDQPLFGGTSQRSVRLEVQAALYSDGSWDVAPAGGGSQSQASPAKSEGDVAPDDGSLNPDKSIETGQGDTEPEVDPDIDTPVSGS